jgi:hypothetical protein
VTNQRTKTSVEDVEDTKDVADTVVGTVYPKEGKAAEEGVTRSHLTKIIMLRTLSLSLRITLRIVLAMINVPFIGRRVITRQTVGDIRSISQCA